jgi:hypothetical protein
MEPHWTYPRARRARPFACAQNPSWLRSNPLVQRQIQIIDRPTSPSQYRLVQPPRMDFAPA